MSRDRFRAWTDICRWTRERQSPNSAVKLQLCAKAWVGPDGEGVLHGSLGSLMFVAAVAIAGVGRADGMPDWAFSANPPAPKPASPPMDDGIVIHVAGSAVGMTQSQV